MIDDDEEDFMIIRDIIIEIDHHKFTIDWVPSYDEGLKKISEKTHDVYLIDYRLGVRTGLELITEAVKGGCAEPMIILTGQNDIAVDIAAMNAGASDYMVKGTINAQILESSIRYAIMNSKHIKEINQLNEALEKKVKDRTLILEQTLKDLEASKNELNEALKKEKELNELKTRFISTVSHEFRTPLAVILSSLSLTSNYGQKQDFASQVKHLTKMRSSVNHLNEMLNDLLSIGEQEEGKVSVTPERLNMPDIIGDVVKEMNQLLKSGQVINYDHNGVKDGFINKKILKHIITNLVSNAIKFSEENKVITLKSEVNNSSLKLSVEDQGMGISEADQKHLFERFFRGKNATNIKGTGLGLNIIGGFVEMMKGSIHISSQLGKGTLISIEVPNRTDRSDSNDTSV